MARIVATAAGTVQTRHCYHAPVKLHQLKVDYNAEQDRLLMQIAASDAVELRMWLTRRFVKLLWPLLVKLAEEASPRIRTQANPEARRVRIARSTDCSAASLTKRTPSGARR
jgi:hypothetical protein